MNGFQLRMPTYTGNAQFARQKFCLLQRQFGQRRAANQTIAMLHFLHHWLRKRPPTGYPQEKVRHLFDESGLP